MSDSVCRPSFWGGLRFVALRQAHCLLCPLTITYAPRINIFLLVNCATVLSFYTVLFYCTRQWWPKLHENWPIWPFLRHLSACRVQNTWPPALSFQEVLWGHYGCLTLHFEPLKSKHENLGPTFCAKLPDFGQLPQMYGARRELFFWPQPLSFWEVVRVCPKSISSIHGWSPKSATNELRHGLFGSDLKSWLSRVRPVVTGTVGGGRSRNSVPQSKGTGHII